MNEELQKRILDALDKLIEGAPEVWVALCEEVVVRGYAHMAILAIIGLIGLVCGGISVRFNKKANWDVPDDGAAWGTIIFGAASVLIVLITFYNAYSAVDEIASPALFLLGR